MNRAQIARFQRFAKPQPSGCWLFMSPAGTKDGYAHFKPADGYARVMAHKFSYEAFKGPIPSGMQVGHTCHDKAVADGTCTDSATCQHRRCVNPAHLELQTPSQNTSLQNHHERNVTACPKGHPYEGENLIQGKDGKRRCRTCHNARRQEQRRRES